MSIRLWIFVLTKWPAIGIEEKKLNFIQSIWRLDWITCKHCQKYQNKSTKSSSCHKTCDYVASIETVVMEEETRRCQYLVRPSKGHHTQISFNCIVWQFSSTLPIPEIWSTWDFDFSPYPTEILHPPKPSKMNKNYTSFTRKTFYSHWNENEPTAFSSLLALSRY